MARMSLLTLSLPLAVLYGCSKTDTVTTDIAYPRMVLSGDTLEFGASAQGETVERTLMLSNEGEMPMGVKEISIGENMGLNFSVTYLTAEKTCPTSSGGDTGTKASAKTSGIDTGPENTDTGGGIDTGSGGVDVGDGNSLFILDPGCSIPVHVTFSPVDVGEVWGAVIVEASQAEDPGATDTGATAVLPEYLRDQSHWRQEAWLHGSSSRSQGTLIVRPRSYDFGYVNPAATTPGYAYIGVENVGTGPITLSNVRLSDECDEAFALQAAPSDGYLLEAGESSLVQVAFDPTDDQAAYCQVVVTSDDPASPEVDVTLTGNSGSDPNNHPPTVSIRNPDNGYLYSTIRDFEMEINIFDVDQPASTLECYFKSAVVQEQSLGQCAATDDSGHLWVTIPAEDMESGVDTLVVTVTDGNGVSAEASVSVVIDGSYPASDDDGDGYGTVDLGDGVVDCDDSNRFTYPKAAEVFDGDDNDCNGTVDEGTVGYDDDGDHFSEDDGDCNDYNNSAYPGAAERPDGVDNDCDSVVDEGTSLYDDDGDGYAEVNNDCNDNEAAINPAAVELCDGLDNDCDGLRDSADGCVASSSVPLIIGELRPSQNACEEGDVITVEANVFDPDGQVPTMAWQDNSEDQAQIDNPASTIIHWTCPTLPDDASGGKNYNLWTTATDPDLQQDYSYIKIAVYPKGHGLYSPYTLLEIVPREGCATTEGSPAALLAGLAGLIGLLRRKRQD